MKKNLLSFAISMIIAILATSCEPPKPTMPQDIKGFWQCQATSNAFWYGLEVIDNQTAILRTYQETEEIEAIDMSLTYDAITGKGQLLGDGIFLQVQAMSEEIIHIKMVEGEIAFTKGKKPAKTYSLTGLWNAEAMEDIRLDLLIFPKNNDQIDIAYILVDEIFGDMLATMGTISKFDSKTASGELNASYHNGNFILDTIANPLKIKYIEDNITYTLTKVVKKNIILKSMRGTWYTSIPGLAEVTINVDDSNNCTIDYSIIDISSQKTKSGTTKGILHFCPQARMGALEPANQVTNEEFIELFGEEGCGIFSVQSSTEVIVNTMGMEVIFQKQ